MHHLTNHLFCLKSFCFPISWQFLQESYLLTNLFVAGTKTQQDLLELDNK